MTRFSGLRPREGERAVRVRGACTTRTYAPPGVDSIGDMFDALEPSSLSSNRPGASFHLTSFTSFHLRLRLPLWDGTLMIVAASNMGVSHSEKSIREHRA